MSEPLTPDLERWARGSFSPMAQRHAWNEVDRLRDELRQLREAARPFAKFAGDTDDLNKVDGVVPLSDDQSMDESGIYPPSIGACRKLAALLPAKGADHAR